MLPDHKYFYSKLALQNVSEEDYNHAQTVWKEFNCSNMLDYTRIYVISDTVLLAEVIQTFRRKIHNEFKLDPVHFVSLPALAKDIMLKTSRCSLDMIHESNMCYFFKSGIRGGLSYVNTRKACIDELEKKTGEKYTILYLDANNLYGCSMSRPLPVGGYRWLTQDEIQSFDFQKISFESVKGYAFEVTLEYPEHLHIDHNSFPLAAEHVTVEEDMLSPYASSCLSELGMNFSRTKKLTATFGTRSRYVCHGMNLKLYLELGLKLKEVHSGVEFTQGCFMKKFVDICAKKRREAVTKMDSMIYKKLVNSVFGKVSFNTMCMCVHIYIYIYIYIYMFLCFYV